jgi:hypothetical protein
MDLEKMIKTPRLDREHELKEREEYESTDDLKRKIDILDENMKRLEAERMAISRATDDAQSIYYTQSSERNSLEKFKDASEKIDQVVESNREALEANGINDKADLVNDEQLSKSDQVEAYRVTGKVLRRDVAAQRSRKDKLKQVYADHGDVVLRKEVRRETFGEIWDKVQEIQNSIDALAEERRKVVEQLAEQVAGEMWKIYKSSKAADFFQWSKIKNAHPISIQKAFEGDSLQLQRLMDRYGDDVVAIALKKVIMSDQRTQTEYQGLQIMRPNFEKAVQALAEYEVAYIENDNTSSDRAHDAFFKAEKIKKEKEIGEAMLRHINEEKLNYAGQEPVLLNIESEDKYGGLSADEAYSFKITYSNEAAQAFRGLKDEKTARENEMIKLEKEISDLEAWVFVGKWENKLRELKKQKSELELKIKTVTYDIEHHHETAATAVKERIALPLRSESKELSSRIERVAQRNMYTHDYFGRGYHSARMAQEIHTVQEYLDAIEKVTKEFLSEQVLSENEQLLASKYGKLKGNDRAKLSERVSKTLARWEDDGREYGI